MPALDSLHETGPVPASLALISLPLPKGVEVGQPDCLRLDPRGGSNLGHGLDRIPSPEVLDQEAQTP